MAKDKVLRTLNELKEGDRVQLEWVDTAYLHEQYWQERGDTPLETLAEPTRITSVGFFVGKTGDGIVLAQSVHDEEHGGLIVIPPQVITEIVEI